MLFEIDWEQDGKPRHDRMVLRMDPAESHNATSRLRKAELLRAFRGIIPVPEVFFVDADGKWFPEPTLIYAFAEGVTKPRATSSGAVSGLGIHFGPEWRAKLGPHIRRAPGEDPFVSDRERPVYRRWRRRRSARRKPRSCN